MRKGFEQYISVADKNGEIKKIPIKEIKEHEEFIIEDNIFHGYKHPEIFSQKDIDRYEHEARHEFNLLKKAMKEHPYSLYGYEQCTETLKEIIINESNEPREYSIEEARLAMEKLNKR